MKRFIQLFPLSILALGISVPVSAGWFEDWSNKGMEVLRGVEQQTPAGVEGVPLASLTQEQVIAGLKEALLVGSERVVNQLGVEDGFNADPQIHIPLPDSLSQVKGYLEPLGMAPIMDDLELRLNRAAEQASPQAKQLFIEAIKRMTIEDAKAIYEGADDAATQYFKRQMAPELKVLMRPIVTKTLEQAGAVQLYDQVMGQYQSLPFVPDVKANLEAYVVEQGVNGLFYYIAKEEAAIRNNPAERTTDILKKVFGDS